MAVDRVAAARAVEDFLRALGRNLAEPELRGTPARVAAAWADELCDGYAVDVARLLRDESSEVGTGGGLVVLRDISVVTVCPHHLLPAHGRAAVAYEPRGRVLGLGTIVQLVAAFSHRLTLQETIGEAVVRALVDELGAARAACRIALRHECLASRGERERDAIVETIATHGLDAASAAQLLAIGAP